MNKKTILVFLFSLYVFIAFSQNQTFQKFGIKDGLSSSRVFTSVEDDLGFLWIATDIGVDRFDGNNFKHYELSDFSNIRKEDFYRFYLQKDKNNQIWLLANNGSLFKYSISHDKFILYHALYQDLEFSIKANFFWIDHNQRFWIGSEFGLYFFDIKTKKIVLNKKVTGSVQAITQDKENNIYLAGSEGVFILNKDYELQHNLLDVSHTANIDIHKGKIRSLFFDESYNRLWLGTDKRGLCAFNLTNFDFIIPLGLERYKGLYIRSIEGYTPNSIIASVDGVGLIVLNLSDLILVNKFSFTQNDPNSLSSNSIFDILKNRDGIFFISTFRGGLNSYNPQQLGIQYLNQIPGDPNSLDNNNILSISEVSEDIIAFGTSKGVSIWDKANNKWSHLSKVANQKNILSGFVHALAVDKDKNIWTSSHTNYITKYDLGKSGKYTVANNAPKEYYSEGVFDIFALNSGLIYFANASSGVMQYSISTKTTKLFPIKGVKIIESLTPEDLVLGGSEGLFILNTESSESTVPEFIENSILNGKSVNSLFVDEHRQLWVGTADSGIFIVNFDKESIEHISTNEGLPSNFIFSIIKADSYIWAATSVGISRIDRNRNIYTLFKSDGLISTDFNKNAVIKSSDNKLYFGTNQGVVYFDPMHIRSIKSQKSLVLTDFYINHKLTFIGEDSPLKTALNQTKIIELDYAQNSFAIGFSTIDFVHPDIGKVQWKLEGFDKDWIFFNKIDRINYTNLSPNKYTLKLRIINERGEILTNERHIDIIIKSPFWLSYWAFIIYTLLLILLVVTINYFLRLRMNSKNSEERLHYLINMAHDIKTPLTLIKAPLQDILQNEQNNHVKQNVNIALSSADKLQKQMLQFLDFKKIKVKGKPLIKESIDLHLFFQDKLLAFTLLCQRKKIDLSFDDSSISNLRILSDRKIIDVVVSNLLTNAVKFTNENGKIHISLNIKNDNCEISIKDSGIGIPKSQQKKIFNLFYRSPQALEAGIPGSGVGLILASDLAKKLDGKVFLSESSNKGSTFKFIFPIEIVKKENRDVSESSQDIVYDRFQENDHRIKLLFVEDDKELLNYAKLRLQKTYQIITASNGKQAFDLVLQNLPDIVISDISMPKMNGRQLCMNLKSKMETCHIPVVLLTGLSSKQNILQGLESGADEYITKPVEFDILVKKIDGIIENRQILKRKFLQLDETENFDILNELDTLFITNINTYIEENISDPELSVYDLYEFVCMSRTPFYHKLKSLVDLSPSEYIRSIRLKRARALLKEKNKNISEVAYSVGFSNPKYFSTSYKKYYGQSPSAYVREISLLTSKENTSRRVV